jgi:hypothetical protein
MRDPYPSPARLRATRRGEAAETPATPSGAAAAADTDAGSAPVQDILRRLDATARTERVTMGDVLEAFGRRSFLPMLMVPALLVLSPLSGIPLFSTVCGLTIALVSAQMLWPGRDCLWLPDRLTRQRVSGERARQAVARLGRLARWLDTHARGRARLLVRRRPGTAFLEACCLAAGLAMPVFELVPFTSSVLGLAVLLIATGLLTRDGLYAVAGLTVLVAAPLVPVLILDSVFGSGGSGGAG